MRTSESEKQMARLNTMLVRLAFVIVVMSGLFLPLIR
jgi:hypothetical protein